MVDHDGGRVPALTVRDLDALTECRWDFRRGPEWIHPHGFPMGATWDPFPAYAHQYAEAAATAHEVVDACPPLYDITILLADREDEGRTNGWSHLDKHHGTADGAYQGVIMLAGKRIPPHPAMTRHLVGHEYGHHLEWMLNLARGAKTPYDQQVTDDYARARHLPATSAHHGDGGTWHDSVHEVMACDFRIHCGIEPEYWPHPGVSRPEHIAGLARWWADALDEIRAAAATTGTVELS
jgi:hypothetical protein